MVASYYGAVSWPSTGILQMGRHGPRKPAEESQACQAGRHGLTSGSPSLNLLHCTGRRPPATIPACMRFSPTLSICLQPVAVCNRHRMSLPIAVRPRHAVWEQPLSHATNLPRRRGDPEGEAAIADGARGGVGDGVDDPDFHARATLDGAGEGEFRRVGRPYEMGLGELVEELDVGEEVRGGREVRQQACFTGGEVDYLPRRGVAEGNVGQAGSRPATSRTQPWGRSGAARRRLRRPRPR